MGLLYVHIIMLVTICYNIKVLLTISQLLQMHFLFVWGRPDMTSYMLKCFKRSTEIGSTSINQRLGYGVWVVQGPML